MLIIRLREVMELLQQERKSIVTVTEIAEATGIHRKILSRLHNRPGASIKGDTIDRLAQFFFAEFVRYGRSSASPQKIMEWVVQSLVMVYPDDELFLKAVLSELKLPPQKAVGKLAGQLRRKAATVLWTKFESLPEEDREARLLEIREREKKDKPKAKRRKTNSRRTAKGGRLLG
jgi:hypothetical protein